MKFANIPCCKGGTFQLFKTLLKHLANNTL